MENIIRIFEPSPCPFCGAKMRLDEDDNGMFYMHPFGKCIMSAVILSNIDEIKMWQTRVVGQHPEKSEK